MQLYEYQQVVLNNLRNNENILLNAPTGSGKTYPAILYIKEIYDKANRIYWLVPFKALAIDKYNELKDQFDSVGILTGEYKENTNAKVIVAIYESFLNRTQYSNEKIDFIILDEIHTINDRDRIFDTITYLNRHKDIQYYAISGTFKDMKYLLDNAKYIQVDETFNIKPEIVRLPESLIYNNYAFINDIIDKYQTLIFKFSKQRIRNTVSEHINYLNDKGIIIENVKDELLKEAIRYGIGFYTSDLDVNDKQIVQDLFDAKIIKCIYTTDSISTGVNLPVDVIIMSEIEKFDGYIDQNTLIQIYGRVGRKGKSKISKIYIPYNAPEYFENPKQQNILNIKDKAKYLFKKLINF